MLLGNTVYNKSVFFFLNNKPIRSGRELPEQMFRVIMFGLIVFVT